MEFTEGEIAFAARLHEEFTEEGEWVGDRQDAVWAWFPDEEWETLLTILRKVGHVEGV